MIRITAANRHLDMHNYISHIQNTRRAMFNLVKVYDYLEKGSRTQALKYHHRGKTAITFHQF